MHDYDRAGEMGGKDGGIGVTNSLILERTCSSENCLFAFDEKKPTKG